MSRTIALVRFLRALMMMVEPRLKTRLKPCIEGISDNTIYRNK